MQNGGRGFLEGISPQSAAFICHSLLPNLQGYVARLSKELPEDTLRQMHGYYEKLLRKYPDVVTVKDVVALTGYTLTTVHNWCSRGSLKAFQKGLKFCIPKIFLVDFFCSLTFRSITRKSLWHIQMLNEFSRKLKK